MRLQSLLLLCMALLVLAEPGLTPIDDRENWVGQACGYIDTVRWAGFKKVPRKDTTGAGALQKCKSAPYLTSVALCGEANFPGNWHRIYKVVDSVALQACRKYNLDVTSDQVRAMYQNYSKLAIPIPRVNKTAMQTKPIGFNQTWFDEKYPSIRVYQHNLDLGQYYGNGMTAWWALILVIGIAINVFRTVLFPSISDGPRIPTFCGDNSLCRQPLATSTPSLCRLCGALYLGVVPLESSLWSSWPTSPCV